MPFARLAVALTLAGAAALPATADAVLICVHPQDGTWVCRDTARPECVGYGAVAGVEFELGTYCR